MPPAIRLVSPTAPLTPTDALLALAAPEPPTPTVHLTTDWLALCELARVHGLAPLLHQRLASVLDALPHAARARLHDGHTNSAAFGMLLEWEQQQLVATFRAAGLPLLLFKGIPLARALFGDPALRPMQDIDVLVHSQDMEASCALVGELGWTAVASEFQDKNLDFEKEVMGARVVLELHWSNQRRGEYDLPEARLWEETVETLEGTLFTREMNLLSLTLHTARHAFRPYRQLVDIAHAVTQWYTDLDWNHLAALAAEARALPMLAIVLALVARDMGAPLPPHAGLRRLMARSRTRLALRLLSPKRLLVPDTLARTERYLIPLLSGAWQPATFFLRDILRSPRQMAAIYGLPEGSPRVWLFYLLRPLLLLAKALRGEGK